MYGVAIASLLARSFKEHSVRAERGFSSPSTGIGDVHHPCASPIESKVRRKKLGKKLSAVKSSMFLQLSDQGASGTAACCCKCPTRPEKAPAARRAAPERASTVRGVASRHHEATATAGLKERGSLSSDLSPHRGRCRCRRQGYDGALQHGIPSRTVPVRLCTSRPC